MKKLKTFTVIPRTELKKIAGAGVAKAANICQYSCGSGAWLCPASCFCNVVRCEFQ